MSVKSSIIFLFSLRDLWTPMFSFKHAASSRLKATAEDRHAELTEVVSCSEWQLVERVLDKYILVLLAFLSLLSIHYII